MTLLGYHASHEQFSPSDLLKWVCLAEKLGFQAINSSDHFHPWSEAQGQSGFSFAWLGAAMQATKLPFGMVCTPGYRYHPAIIAQAMATLAEMFPQRFSIALGSGEALNENITGERWPLKEDRNKKLRECNDLIKRLLDGELVTHRGTVVIQEARLYTRPEIKPLIIGAAVTEKTAAWMGSWADGLITINHSLEQVRKIVKAFRNNGGEDKPLFLKAQLSYDKTKNQAIAGAHHQWKTNILPAEILDDLWLPKQYDAAAKFVRPEDVEKAVIADSDASVFIDYIHAYAELGFERIILHNVNREQEQFIKFFGEEVLPNLKLKAGKL